MSRASPPGSREFFPDMDPRVFPYGLLTPREVFELFDPPVCGLVTVPTAGSTQLVREDPDRVVLMFAATTSIPCWVAPSSAVPNEIGGDRGIQMEENDTLVLTLASHGPLAQFGWHVWGTLNGAFVYVIQLLAPRMETYLKGIALNRAEQAARELGRRVERPRGFGQFGSVPHTSPGGGPTTTPGFS